MTARIRWFTGDTFRSMRHRNFRVFFTGQSVSQAGAWMTLVAQTLLVLSITGSGVAVGLLAAFQFTPILLFGAWAGLIADRSDKRRLLLTVQSVSMAQAFFLAALAFMPSPPLAAIYFAALVGGFVIAFENPTRRSLIVEMVPVEDVQNAVSLNSAVMTGARVVGPAVAGGLIALVGFGWVFALDGLSRIAILTSVALVRTSELRAAPLAPAGKGQVRAGLRYVYREPLLWIPLVMTAIIGTFAMNFQVTLPLFVNRGLGQSATMFTLLYAVLSIGSFAGALLTARRRIVDVRHAVIAAIAFGVGLLALASMPSIGWALVVGLFVGVASIAFITTSTALLQVHAVPSMRGRVLALQAIVFFGSTPVGGPLMGWISDTFTPRAAIAIGGLAALVSAAWGVLAQQRETTRSAARDEDAVELDVEDADLQPA